MRRLPARGKWPSISSADRSAGAVLMLVGGLLVSLAFLGLPPFTMTLLTEALILAIWAMSLDLLVGFAGLVSFGHAAPFGLASYAAGYFAREVCADFVLSLLFAEAVVIAVAALTGLLLTRVSGVAFAIISLAIAQVLFQVAVAWRPVTEGMDGLVGVPLPSLLGARLTAGRAFYLLTASLFIVAYFVLRGLVRSPFGHTLHAIRTNEIRAASIGINLRLHKWLALVISWALAGVAGTLLVFMKAGTTPMSLYWTESGNVLVMTILGGLRTLFGPAIGAVLFVFVRDEFTSRFQAWQFAFGLVFVLLVLLFPSGIGGSARYLWEQLWRRRF